LTAGVSRLVVESLSQADSVYLSRPRLPSAVKVWIRELTTRSESKTPHRLHITLVLLTTAREIGPETGMVSSKNHLLMAPV